MIEGNLLSICASFPSIRRFFRLVAPRWIGEFERKPFGNNALNEPGVLEEHPFRTFGAAYTRNQLDTLGLTRDCSNEEAELEAVMAPEVEVR
jgi:hypothetical protein